MEMDSGKLEPAPHQNSSSSTELAFQDFESSLLPKAIGIQKQYDFFAIRFSDSAICKDNKRYLCNLLQNLEEKGKLVEESMKDYNILHSFRGGQAIVQICTLKTDPQMKKKAIKQIEFGLREKLENFKEIEILCAIDHPNVMNIEKIFFEIGNGGIILNIVMPCMENDFISWLIKEDPSKASTESQAPKFSRIPENKRSFDEVRNLLIGTLKGIDLLHLRDFIHLDIKFDNTLVDAKDNAVVADLGSGQANKDLKTQFFFTPEFCPPEIDLFSKDSLDTFMLIDKDKLSRSVEVNFTEKSDYFTNKADMYSFGVMLFKLFIDEKEKANISLVKKENIQNRIQQLFPNEPEPISDLLIEDLEVIMKSLLDDDKKKRFDAGILLFEHPFFNKTVSKMPSKPEKALIDEKLVETIKDPTELFVVGLRYLEGIGIERNIKKARSIFEKLSREDKYPPAQYYYGWMLQTGYGGPLDKEEGKELCKSSAEKAFEFFSPEAELGDPNALSALGRMYQEGHYLPKDIEKSFDNYKRAANKNHSIAQYYIGQFYHNGTIFAPRNLRLCSRYYNLSANRNNPQAQTQIGWMYDDIKDFGNAIKYYELAANQEDCNAQNILGRKYQLAASGVEKDLDKAIDLFKKAIDQGLPSAMNNLGILYKHEKGPEIEQCRHLSADLFKRAANLGFKSALHRLARFCIHQKDYKSMMENYEKAAAKGYGPSLRNIAFIYQKGGYGFPKDLQKAFEYLKGGAAKKEPISCFELAKMYEKGEGVEKDLKKAVKFYELTVKIGRDCSTEAKEKLKTLKQDVEKG